MKLGFRAYPDPPMSVIPLWVSVVWGLGSNDVVPSLSCQSTSCDLLLAISLAHEG